MVPVNNQSALKGQTEFTNSQINMNGDKLTTGIHVDPKWKNWKLTFCFLSRGHMPGSRLLVLSRPVRSEESWRPSWTWWTSCLSKTCRAGCQHITFPDIEDSSTDYWGTFHIYLLPVFIDLFLNWLKLVVTVSIRDQWGSGMENYFSRDRNIECKVRWYRSELKTGRLV